MPRNAFFLFYFAAIFLQSGTYGLTFLLPPLFAGCGADEKDVGAVLAVTMATTLMAVLYLGHITARFGRMATVGASGILIAISLFLFGTGVDAEVGGDDFDFLGGADGTFSRGDGSCDGLFGKGATSG